MLNFLFLLTQDAFPSANANQMVQPPSFFLIRPIINLFGFIFNLLYEAAVVLSDPLALGLTIIFITIIFRLMTLPLFMRSQKAFQKMRELKPEQDKIKAKYGNTTDPELRRKMQAEQAALMAKHGANPLTSCLPMLLQMPIFIALNTVIRTSFLHVNRLNDMFNELSQALINVPGLIGDVWERGVIWRFLETFVPNGEQMSEHLLQASNVLAERGLTYTATLDDVHGVLEELGASSAILYGVPEELTRVIGNFNMENWTYVLTQIQHVAPQYYANISGLVDNAMNAGTFLGLRLAEQGSLTWPAILVPIITLIVSFFASLLQQQRNFDPHADDRARLNQKMMLFMMPIFLAVTTIFFQIGIGLFWIVGQLFQATADIILFKRDGVKIRNPFSKQPEVTVVDKIPSKKK